MIRFDYGANSANFVLNKRTLVPTALTASLGMPNIGIHINLGVSPDALTQQAYVDWIRTMYTSMSAMANRTAVQQYKAGDVGHYMQFCAIIDVLLAEAKRDMTMVHFGDLYTTNAAADYWGPLYSNVIQDTIENGPKYWSRWNALARRMSEMYPHLTVSYYEQFRYMLSTVFQDSDSGRWNFIYFHLFNQSFLDDAYFNISPTRALDIAEDLVSKFEAAVAQNSTATDPMSVGITNEKLAAIKADLLNAYGSAVDRSYGYVIDFHTMPTSTYDADLISLLNNNVPVPDMYVGQNVSVGNHVHNYADWEYANTAAVAFLTSTGNTLLFSIEDKVKFTTSVEAQYSAIMAKYADMKTYPITLYGPAFDGAPGLFNTSLVQNWSISGGSSGSNYTVEVNPDSHFGVTTGQLFIFSNNGTAITRTLLSSGLVVEVQNAPLANAVSSRMMDSLNAINHMDCGNYIVWRPFANGYYTLAEPVDEFAIISRESLGTYTSAGIFGLFDTNVTKFRTTRSAEYVVTDNTAYVKDNSKSTGKGDYHGKKRTKKYKSKAE